MAEGIYSVKNEEIVLHPDVIGLCPVLKDMDQDDLKFMIVAFDYTGYSPWFRKPADDRKQIALRKYIPSGKSPETNKLFQKQLDEFQSIIFSEKHFIIDIYRAKLMSLHTQLVEAEDPSLITDIDKAIMIINKRIDELNTQISQEAEIIELKAGRKLSLLEQMKRNQQLYKLRPIDKSDGL